MPQIQGISLNVQVYSKDSVSVAVLYFLRTTVCIKQDNLDLCGSLFYDKINTETDPCHCCYYAL